MRIVDLLEKVGFEVEKNDEEGIIFTEEDSKVEE